MKGPLATISCGMLGGVSGDGHEAFYGVPYAASPVGERRFAAPVAHDSWTGVRDASFRGPTAPQLIEAFDAFDSAPLAGPGWQHGDDYLTANVWTPGTHSKPAPVMVFIHGGSWLTGSNNVPACDGAAFARSGIVCISLNYRLGIEGFFPIEGVPTNLGIRDLLFALKWVHDHAAAFGGDAGNVSLFGQSAGAMLIGCLVTSPQAHGLFRRAILQSGHGSMVRVVEVARRMVGAVAQQLGVPAEASGFRSRTAEQCLQALRTVVQSGLMIDLANAHGYDPIYGLSPVSPVYGDDILPQLPLAALAAGAGRELELLIGTDREEMNLYYVPNGVRDSIDSRAAEAIVQRSHPSAGAILAAYGLGAVNVSAGDVFTRTMTDMVFRTPSRLFALAHRGSSHVYEFGWRSPACDGQLGACHAVEVPFVFKTLALCAGPSSFLGVKPPQTLAERVHSLWVGFACSGCLPWPEYRRAQREVFDLESGTSNIEAVTGAEPYLGL